MVDATTKSIDYFFSDAASGSLPDFCIVDPDFSSQSQENPQNIVVGEAFLQQVVEAIGTSPAWPTTLLIINYDEHGGYYDHVVPPVAIAPDAVPPAVQPGESAYDGFNRYGFRVPLIVVSPYAKRNHVSHMVYDHTSILATVERKWNLPALTYRDANANDLMDFLDTDAMARALPSFPKLPPCPIRDCHLRPWRARRLAPEPSRRPAPSRGERRTSAGTEVVALAGIEPATPALSERSTESLQVAHRPSRSAPSW